MEKSEFRAASSLAAVFSVRLLGLFMVYPVFADYAAHLSGTTPYKVGLALGIYGLSQGVLQIPFGLLSDKVGRKPMIIAGLVVFGIGSAVSAMSTSIDGVIVGRVLQGAGAIGSVILALVADLTSEESRTKAMALVGITIGASFMVALVAGPILAGLVRVGGIFWIMVALAATGIVITVFAVPRPPALRMHRDTDAVPAMLGSVLRNKELLRLDFGIFALHAILTASFLVVPALLHDRLHVTSGSQWMVFLPVLGISVVLMVPAIVVAEKYRQMKGIFIGAVAALAVSQFMLAFGQRNVYAVLAAITLFFSGFNVMEASLPSLVTKAAPLVAKGTATGIYSSSQFLGIFVGGIVGGWVQQAAGRESVFEWTGALALLWLVAAAAMQQPSYLTTQLIRIGHDVDTRGVADSLRHLPGVADVVAMADEELVYLKVDSRVFDRGGALSIIARQSGAESALMPGCPWA